MSEIHNEIRVIQETFPGQAQLNLFDVGACNFHDSLTLRHHFPFANIFAFEPDKVNLQQYSEAAENCSINVVPVAVSDVNDEKPFYHSLTFHGNDHRASGSTLKPRIKKGTSEGLYHDSLLFDMEGTLVQTVRLDTFCELNGISNIHFLHIDVQGAEERVIRGLGSLRPAFIFAETCEFDTYESGTTLQDFDQLLFDMDYEVVKRFKDDTLYRHTPTIPMFSMGEWLPKI